ncbi:RNA pyrophosphohydrolase [SAR86 cluster bacterium]|nr:RNA pyrophosphohydrolase [SAR86 cluster bacterium]
MPKKEILDKKKPSFSKTPDDLNIEGFAKRHIGLKKEDIQSITNELGFNDLVDFVNAVVPNNILIDGTSDSDGLSEEEALNKLKSIAKKNKIYKTFIGQGYYPSFTPSIIKRKVFENPGWYTSYTPYQAEISQGRLEALINFQTMVQDLTDLDISNASLLDEPTAAAEAMALANRTTKLKSKLFLLDANSFPQTQSVVLSRARPLNIEVIIDKPENFKNYEAFGALIQYPGNDGSIKDYTEIVSNLNKKSTIAIAATDLLALTLIKSPGEMGFDIAIGNSQRFGVPLGFGGPHAAFMSAKESFKRSIPGRLVGASIDKFGNTAYRLALQTREQHIRREKATSNICTAQALLAIMASFYAIYHGPDGLKNIAILCKRSKTDNWQFPQGGIDKKETPLDAAYRELFEEVNIQKNQVELISEYPEWIKYDLPPKFKKTPYTLNGFKGQNQKWFLFMLKEDVNISFHNDVKPEFDSYDWVNYWSPLEKIIYFKKDVYEKVLKGFSEKFTELCLK